MGICMSTEAKILKHAEKMPASYTKIKSEEKESLGVEYANYDYVENHHDRERLGVICVPHAIGTHPDRIAIVDLDEKSSTYSQIVGAVDFLENGEEPGKMNWTRSATNLDNMKEVPRTHMVIPCMNSSRIYIVAVEGTTLKIAKVIPSEELLLRNLSCPYSVHCLPIKGAPVHVSTMGDKEGRGKGDFLLLDRKTFNIRTRQNRDNCVEFGGDFALQTRHNILISCEWGHPNVFRNGLSAGDLENEKYGNRLHVWQISPGLLKQSIELDDVDGSLTSCIRFLHNGDCNHAFACSALGSSIFHLYMESVEATWAAAKVVHVPTLRVSNWMCSEMPALLTDLIISLDDKNMFAAGWLQGIIWQFDIADPFRVTLKSQICVGGVLNSQPEVRVLSEETNEEIPSEPLCEHGQKFRGGPANLQLSLDGNRLYVTNSYYKAWDAQFYPEMASTGGQMIRIDVGGDTQGMKMNDKFLLDLKDMENGPYVVRDLRFTGGDCTADNFL